MAYYGAHVVIVPVYYPVVYYVPMQQNFYNQKRSRTPQYNESDNSEYDQFDYWEQEDSDQEEDYNSNVKIQKNRRVNDSFIIADVKPTQNGSKSFTMTHQQQVNEKPTWSSIEKKPQSYTQSSIYTKSSDENRNFWSHSGYYSRDPLSTLSSQNKPTRYGKRADISYILGETMTSVYVSYDRAHRAAYYIDKVYPGSYDAVYSLICRKIRGHYCSRATASEITDLIAEQIKGN